MLNILGSDQFPNNRNGDVVRILHSDGHRVKAFPRDTYNPLATVRTISGLYRIKYGLLVFELVRDGIRVWYCPKVSDVEDGASENKQRSEYK